MSKSIIDNPAVWTIPADVARRDSEMREGIERARQQRRDDEERRKSLSHSILTPEPAFPPEGFAERYALHLDITTGETFLVPDPNGEVSIGGGFVWCGEQTPFGQDDDPEE